MILHSLHLNKIKSSIETTLKGWYISIEWKLFVQKINFQISIGIFHQINSCSNIISILAMSHQFHFDSIINLSCSIRVYPILLWYAIYCTISCTGWAIRAKISIPLNTCKAISISPNIMNPSPILIESNLPIFSLATRTSTLLIG